LCYETVYQIKKDFPGLQIILNGGVKTVDHIEQHLKNVDGVMLGREVCRHPLILAEVERLFDEAVVFPSRLELIEQWMPYMHEQLNQGVRLLCMARHLLGLFHGVPGAQAWRRYLSEQAHKRDAGVEVIERALSFVS